MDLFQMREPFRLKLVLQADHLPSQCIDFVVLDLGMQKSEKLHFKLRFCQRVSLTVLYKVIIKETAQRHQKRTVTRYFVNTEAH